jgi:hypothetical protein
VALTWAAPTATCFKDYESAEKSCFDHDGDDLCDADYGTDFIAVLGDGSTSTTGKLVQDGGFTGFYSSQPVYFVDAGFPGSNNGVKEDGIAKASLGTIPQAYRPLTSTTCVANFQSTAIFQYVSLQATPKENFYNSGGYEMNHNAVLTIHTDRSVWAELQFAKDDKNYVIEWACQWRSPCC